MRRSARISARKSLAPPTPQGAGFNSQEIRTVEKEKVEKESKRKPQKTPKSVKRGKSSINNDSTNDQSTVTENVLDGVAIQLEDYFTQAENKEKKSSDERKIVEVQEEKREEGDVKDDQKDSIVVKGNDNDGPAKGSGKSPKKLTGNQDHGTRGQANKNIVVEAKAGNTKGLEEPSAEEQEAMMTLSDNVEMKNEKETESFAFEIISKEEFELKDDGKDCLIIEKNEVEEKTPILKEDIGSCQLSSSGEKNLTKSKNDLEEDNDLISQQHVTPPRESQTTSEAEIKSFKKYLKIQNNEKLKINQLSANSSGSKNSLLKLTSEIFQKLPFKITKEDLMTKTSSIDEKFKQSKVDVLVGTKDEIHEQDIIPVTTKGINNVKRENMLCLSSELDPRINTKDLYFNIRNKGTAPVKSNVEKGKKEEQKILKKSVVGSDFEKKESCSSHESVAQKMKKRKQKTEETAGPGWYNLPKAEMTDAVKRDLQVIKMRNVLDPKRFYKRGDRQISKYVSYILGSK